MNLKRILLTAVALSLVIASVLPAIAQTSKGILAGIVRDKTGAVIPGAKVTLTSQDTSETRGAVADERGAYRIDAVSEVIGPVETVKSNVIGLVGTAPDADPNAAMTNAIERESELPRPDGTLSAFDVT